jgi:hypothetical protein
MKEYECKTEEMRSWGAERGLSLTDKGTRGQPEVYDEGKGNVNEW